MTCVINGKPVAIETVSYQERQFGQPPKSIPMAAYELTLTRAEFLERCQAVYEEYARWAREDRTVHRRGLDPLIDYWHDLQFPAFARLLETDHRLLEHVLRKRVGADLFAALLSRGSSPLYVISSLEAVEIQPGRAILRGQAWEV
jgi:anti-sigma factor RsiW